MKDLGEWSEQAGDDFETQFRLAMRNAPRVLPGVQAPTAGLEYTWTDLGNAERLIGRMGNHLVWNEAYGFMVYADGYYAIDEGRLRYTEWAAETKERIAEGAAMVEEGERTGNALLVEHGDAIIVYFRGCQSKFKTDACIEMAKALCFVSRDRFDQNRDLLVVSNGTINLATSALVAHSPLHLMTHGLKVAFNPDAQCPDWLQAGQGEWFKDHPEIWSFLQTWWGYCLTGRTDLQVVLLNLGDGGTGKSTAHNVLHKILEPVAWATNWGTFERKPAGSGTSDIASLAFSRIVFAAEGDTGVRMSEAVLKRASGGDVMCGAFKFKQEFNFWPRFKIMLITNHHPVFTDTSDGLWRRLLLVKWDHKPLVRDLRLETKLLAESEGILAWLVRGARRYYEDGLVIPDVIKEWTQAYRETSDPLVDFVEGHLALDEDAVVPGQAVFDRYRSWAQDQGVHHMRDRSLYAALCERFDIERRRRAGGVHLFGVRLQTAADRAGSVASVDVSHSPEGSSKDSLSLSPRLETATPTTPVTPPQVSDAKSGVAGGVAVSQPLDFEEFQG